VRIVASSGPKRRLNVEYLPAKEQHRMLLERVDDRGERGGVDVSHVDTGDLDAQQRMKRPSLEPHHFLSFRSS
jgi:hypothetical protein